MSLRVSWLRLVCLNGLVVRELQSDFSRLHIGEQILSELSNHLPAALASVLGEKKLFTQWMATVVKDRDFENWIEDTVRRAWGLKAAARAYHITTRGVDVEIQKMVRKTPANSMPIKDAVQGLTYGYDLNDNVTARADAVTRATAKLSVMTCSTGSPAPAGRTVPTHRSCLILDLDITVVTVFGRQEKAEIGYNPRYRGKRSYALTLTFDRPSARSRHLIGG